MKRLGSEFPNLGFADMTKTKATARIDWGWPRTMSAANTNFGLGESFWNTWITMALYVHSYVKWSVVVVGPLPLYTHQKKQECEVIMYHLRLEFYNLNLNLVFYDIFYFMIYIYSFPEKKCNLSGSVNSWGKIKIKVYQIYLVILILEFILSEEFNIKCHYFIQH